MCGKLDTANKTMRPYMSVHGISSDFAEIFLATDNNYVLCR